MNCTVNTIKGLKVKHYTTRANLLDTCRQVILFDDEDFCEECTRCEDCCWCELEEEDEETVLSEKLREAKSLLDLQADWDGHGAEPISREAFSTLTAFVCILDDSLLTEDKMQKISIDPGDGGSVSLCLKWENGGALVEFIPQDDDRIAISYYFENGETGHQGRHWEHWEAATELGFKLGRIFQ